MAPVWLVSALLDGWLPLLAVMSTTVEHDEASAIELASGWLSSTNVVSCLKLVFTCILIGGQMERCAAHWTPACSSFFQKATCGKV